MSYNIIFQPAEEEVYEGISNEAAERVDRKLNQIATSEFREPTEWDYVHWDGEASGKYRIGDIRVFVDIEDSARDIIVHKVAHRTNLYR